MGTLYKINSLLLQAIEANEEVEGAYTDTIEALQLEFNEKIDNLACYIKNINAEVEAMKYEEKALAERRKAKEKKVNRLVGYMKECLKSQNISKLDTPRNLVSIRKCPKSINIQNETQLIEWAERTGFECDICKTKITVSKTDVKQLIDKGIDVPFVEIVQGESLSIK